MLRIIWLNKNSELIRIYLTLILVYTLNQGDEKL